jgi:hypothetical protein
MYFLGTIWRNRARGSFMFGFSVHDAVYVGSALAVGIFCPAVCRKIKAGISKLFSKGESALEARVKALEAKIVKDGQAAVAAAEAEVKKA